VLAPDGKYILASCKLKQLLQMLRTSFSGGQKVICTIAPGGLEDLLKVKTLIEEGVIQTRIDKLFPMEQAAEAHSYVENGSKKGKVVITI
jgi:D-arabinose 1-dehydrogenase-like Zn-dependent alcohol dehydrogenase